MEQIKLPESIKFNVFSYNHIVDVFTHSHSLYEAMSGLTVDDMNSLEFQMYCNDVLSETGHTVTETLIIGNTGIFSFN